MDPPSAGTAARSTGGARAMLSCGRFALALLLTRTVQTQPAADPVEFYKTRIQLATNLSSGDINALTLT